jgi:hypothetical protein
MVNATFHTVTSLMHFALVLQQLSQTQLSQRQQAYCLVYTAACNQRAIVLSSYNKEGGFTTPQPPTPPAHVHCVTAHCVTAQNRHPAVTGQECLSCLSKQWSSKHHTGMQPSKRGCSTHQVTSFSRPKLSAQLSLPRAPSSQRKQRHSANCSVIRRHLPATCLPANTAAPSITLPPGTPPPRPRCTPHPSKAACRAPQQCSLQSTAAMQPAEHPSKAACRAPQQGSLQSTAARQRYNVPAKPISLGLPLPRPL